MRPDSPIWEKHPNLTSLAILGLFAVALTYGFFIENKMQPAVGLIYANGESKLTVKGNLNAGDLANYLGPDDRLACAIALVQANTLSSDEDPAFVISPNVPASRVRLGNDGKRILSLPPVCVTERTGETGNFAKVSRKPSGLEEVTKVQLSALFNKLWHDPLGKTSDMLIENWRFFAGLTGVLFLRKYIFQGTHLARQALGFFEAQEKYHKEERKADEIELQMIEDELTETFVEQLQLGRKLPEAIAATAKEAEYWRFGRKIMNQMFPPKYRNIK